MTLRNLSTNRIDIVGDLRNQNNIGAAGKSGIKGKQSYLMSHNLYNKYSTMAGSRSMNTVNGIGSHLNSRIKAEGHICTVEIIINGLGTTDNIQSFFRQKIGCF